MKTNPIGHVITCRCVVCRNSSFVSRVDRKKSFRVSRLEHIVRQLESALKGAPWRIGYQEDRIKQAKAALKLAGDYFK